MREISWQTARSFRVSELNPVGLAGPNGDELEQKLAQFIDEAITDVVNTPRVDDFLEAVRVEAVHQGERWGEAHDRQKGPADWFWLIGYLLGKALHFGDKRLHHIVSSAAALYHWFDAERTESGCADRAEARALAEHAVE